MSRLHAIACALLASSALVACGSDDSGDDDGNEPIDIDPTGTHTTYVVDGLNIPPTGSAASQFALDIDRDGLPDNALGGLLGSLTATAMLDFQTSIDERLQNGELILLASIKATDLVNANGVGTYVFFGENPSPAACTDPDDLATCGKHLDGNGSFDVAANSPTDASIGGILAAGELTAGPGNVTIQIPLGDSDPLVLSLIAARIEATVTGDNITAARLGGAITEDDVNNELLPAVQDLLAGVIAESCTGEGEDCGCEAGSSGSAALDFLDANGDCMVPLEELKSNSIVDATLGNPDLDLLDANGNFDLGGDGTKDSLSIGVTFTAISGAFDVPAGL